MAPSPDGRIACFDALRRGCLAHEEIGRGDNRLLIVELVDGGIVAGFYADQELQRRRQMGGAARICDRMPGAICEPAAAAVRKRGQAGGYRHRRRGGGLYRHGIRALGPVAA